MLDARIPNKEKHWQPILNAIFYEHLRKYVKDAPTVDAKKECANNYISLLSFAEPAKQQTGFRDERFDIHWDAPYGIVLAFKYYIASQEIPRAIAYISFKIESGPIHINQLQGMPGRQKELFPLRWEKMLYQLVIEIARRLNFKMVEILPAEQNDYYIPSTRLLKLRHTTIKDWRQSLKLRYDVTAKRMGFKWNTEKRVYEYAL